MQHTTRRPARPRTALLTGALAVGFVALGASPALAAPTVESATIVAPATATVGDTIDATVALTDTTDVFAYELTVDFDPAVLDYVDGSATAPSGGFDDVDETDGTLTVTHTRLGTSPALEGDLGVDLQFIAIGAGDGTLELSSVTLVATDGTTTTLEAPSSAAITVEAVVVPPVEPSPTPTTPADGGTGTTPTPSPTATAVAAAGGSGPLAFTGSEAMPGILIGAAALLAGLTAVTVAAIRRRRTAGTR